ncbi:MAG: hypothetical protein LBT29_07280 [Flavobacteriaceae bacterium]|jgi:hypothetical protein|nr:hypothetical protein [Flavobacteriaceae bacterium]
MRRLWLIVGLLMANVLPVFSQDKESIHTVTDKLLFEEIVQFVLSKGDRETYCNMYNNNPHYNLNGIDFYLNPINQHINYFKENLSYTVSDYNEILIDDNNDKKQFRFRIEGEKIYTTDDVEILREYFNKMLNYHFFGLSAEEYKYMGASLNSISDKESKYIKNIDNILNKEEFQNILEYIIKNGDRRTYCQAYNYNPHYSLDGFEIYLNPVHQGLDLSYNIHDYNEIVIYDNSDYRKYFDIILSDSVYIYNAYRYEPQKDFEEIIIEKYIPKLKLLIKDKTGNK